MMMLRILANCQVKWKRRNQTQMVPKSMKRQMKLVKKYKIILMKYLNKRMKKILRKNTLKMNKKEQMKNQKTNGNMLKMKRNSVKRKLMQCILRSQSLKLSKLESKFRSGRRQTKCIDAKYLSKVSKAKENQYKRKRNLPRKSKSIQNKQENSSSCTKELASEVCSRSMLSDLNNSRRKTITILSLAILNQLSWIPKSMWTWRSRLSFKRNSISIRRNIQRSISKNW